MSKEIINNEISSSIEFRTFLIHFLIQISTKKMEEFVQWASRI